MAAQFSEPHGSPTALMLVRCKSCGKEFDHRTPVNTCTSCGSMLECSYDLETAKETLVPEAMPGRVKSLWRYREVLPEIADLNVVTLGEGFTPIVRLEGGTLLKDDGVIPTGSFKARGMAVAVSKA